MAATRGGRDRSRSPSWTERILGDAFFQDQKDDLPSCIKDGQPRRKDGQPHGQKDGQPHGKNDQKDTKDGQPQKDGQPRGKNDGQPHGKNDDTFDEPEVEAGG